MIGITLKLTIPKATVVDTRIYATSHAHEN